MAQTITKSVKEAVEEVIARLGSSDHVFDDLHDGIEQANTGIIAGAIAS